MDSVLYYIWLSLRCGAGSEAPSFLLSHFASPKEVYEADEETLSNVLRGRGGLVAALCDKDMDVARRVYEYCQRANVGVMTLESSIYPERLRAIHAKPIVLYYKGVLPNIDENVLVACVGTRKCSEKGERLAYKLGADLAKAGAIVVSGMALGIDAMCARGALSAGGHTIAVLGCGIDRVYPRENEELMKEIMEKGTVITEYAPGMVPNGKHFPVRNRIISGLCLGTVVVEAGRGSGALITAEHAAKQGRDVFAFPGDVENKFYAGTNELISEGAKMVRGARDILAEYEGLWYKRIFTANISKNKYNVKAEIPPAAPLEVVDYSEEAGKKKGIFSAFRKKAEKRKGISEEELARVKEEAENREVYEEVFATTEEKTENSVPDDLAGFEREVYMAMGDTCVCDEIAAELKNRTGEDVDVGHVLSALTALEIDGYCKSLPGGIFKKI